MTPGSLLAAATLATLITLVPETGDDEGAAERARALLAEGQRAEAVALLESAVAEGTSAEAVLLLGRLHLQATPARARELAAAVLREQPANRVGLELLSASYARARALGLGRAEELELRRLEARDYGQILSAAPRLVEARYRRASALLAVERLLPRAEREQRRAALENALAELEALQSLLAEAPPQFQASVHYQHGRALKHLADFHRESTDPKQIAPAVERRYERALAAFDAALAADPDRVDAVAEQVLVLRSLGAEDEALARLGDKPARGRTRLAQAKMQVMRATLLIDTGRPEAALAPLERALALEPMALDAYLEQWRALQALDRPREAEAAMAAAVAREPQFIDGWLRLGEAAATTGRPAQAIERFGRILAIPEPEAVARGMQPSASQHRAGVYARAAAWLAWLSLSHGGDAEAALRYTQVAERYAPADAHLLDTRGAALHRLGRHAEARQVLLRARELERFPALEFHLAQVEAALGNRAAALAALRAALAEGEFEQRKEAEALLRELEG